MRTGFVSRAFVLAVLATGGAGLLSQVESAGSARHSVLASGPRARWPSSNSLSASSRFLFLVELLPSSVPGATYVSGSGLGDECDKR